MKKIISVATLLSTLLFAGEQFSMSDADRKMYEALLESNPAEIMAESGNELIEEFLGGDEAIAKYLSVSESDLPSYIAGFPRYIKKLGFVADIDQVLQAMFEEKGKKSFKLNSADMFSMYTYVRSLANDEKINIDVNANKHMKKAYELGKYMYEVRRGARGLACASCHAPGVTGRVLRTQILPSLKDGTGATWPAYRMTKSKLSTLPERSRACMKNATQDRVPHGSKELVALTVYIANMAVGKTIEVPGLKR